MTRKLCSHAGEARIARTDVAWCGGSAEVLDLSNLSCRGLALPPRQHALPARMQWLASSFSEATAFETAGKQAS